MNEHKPEGQARNRAKSSQEQNKEKNKEYKSGNIVFSDTVVDPSAVMIILLDASFADLTMVASFGLSSDAFQTDFPGVAHEGLDVALRFLWWLSKQG
jgi:hypothetical protein